MRYLSNVKKDEMFRIVSIPNPQVKAQIIRFGVAEGEVVTCYEVIPSGPVIIKRNKQEIAVGRRLAEEIGIESL